MREKGAGQIPDRDNPGRFLAIPVCYPGGAQKKKHEGHEKHGFDVAGKALAEVHGRDVMGMLRCFRRDPELRVTVQRLGPPPRTSPPPRPQPPPGLTNGEYVLVY